MNFQVKLAAVIAALVGVALLFTFEYPPLETSQSGYRGTGMAQVVNVRAAEKALAAIKTPDVLERSKPSGTKASEVFKNVKVLGDVDQDDFIRLMSAITEWVSPEAGCTFCHKEGEELSADTLYPKIVARRMLQMTRHINGTWSAHVGETGVTCYTCHRGKPVPPALWSKGPEENRTIGMLGNNAGQNMPAKSVGLTSLPADPFSDFLAYANEIRVVSTTALPEGNPRDIKATEHTYALMMHMSQALGVNCTFCHNSRAFSAWDQSSPKRVTSWHGIRMVRSLNMTYIDPLKEEAPVEPPRPSLELISQPSPFPIATAPTVPAAMPWDHVQESPVLVSPPRPVPAPARGPVAGYGRWR